MKKGTITAIIAIVVIGVSAVVVISQGNKSPAGGTKPTTTNTQQTSQVVPVAANPINNPSTQAGLSILKPMVENNVDPATDGPISDQLQFAIKNSSSQPMTNLEVYYKMTDAKTNKSEGYYQKLNGLTIAPGQTTSVFFDNGSGTGHYPENKYSLYRTSSNTVDFTIEVSAPNFQPATGNAQKGPGTGELKNG